jgi:hypothetical protein
LEERKECRNFNNIAKESFLEVFKPNTKDDHMIDDKLGLELALKNV